MSKTTSLIVLVDTSIWIGAHRGKLGADRKLQLEKALREGRAAMNALVWLELLVGFRSPAERRQIEDARAACLWLDLPERLWERAEEVALALQRKGVVLRVADLLIFTAADAQNAALMQVDADFDLACKVEPFTRLIFES